MSSVGHEEHLESQYAAAKTPIAQPFKHYRPTANKISYQPIQQSTIHSLMKTNMDPWMFTSARFQCFPAHFYYIGVDLHILVFHRYFMWLWYRNGRQVQTSCRHGRQSAGNNEEAAQAASVAQRAAAWAGGLRAPTVSQLQNLLWSLLRQAHCFRTNHDATVGTPPGRHPTAEKSGGSSILLIFR